MRFQLAAGLTAVATRATGTGSAVAGSVHVYIPPANHVTVHHYPNGNATHEGILGNFFRGLVGLDLRDDGPQGTEAEISRTDARRMAADQPAAIPTDAERYRLATGKELPASHGTIVLPPTTPNGDETYIWPTSEN